MIEDCHYVVHVVYSTFEYDICMAVVTDIVNRNSSQHFNIGEVVLVFMDERMFEICYYDPFGSLVVTEECVFKLPKKSQTALILPMLKYGCVACQALSIIQRVHSHIVDIYSEYNVFTVISKLMRLLNFTCILVNKEDAKPENVCVKSDHIAVIITSSTFTIKTLDDVYHYDLSLHSMLDTFGHDNIEFLVNLIIQKRLLASVCYVRFPDVPDPKQHKHLRSRFFNIISFS